MEYTCKLIIYRPSPTISALELWILLIWLAFISVLFVCYIQSSVCALIAFQLHITCIALFCILHVLFAVEPSVMYLACLYVHGVDERIN